MNVETIVFKISLQHSMFKLRTFEAVAGVSTDLSAIKQSCSGRGACIDQVLVPRQVSIDFLLSNHCLWAVQFSLPLLGTVPQL